MITMILENNINKIKIYDIAKVDRIFIDLEILGKQERQGHLDTVISNHKISDIESAKKVVKNAKILTRINPINNNTKEEINNVITAGTDIIMLPMFKCVEDVSYFLECVDDRVKTCLLLETAEALCRIDNILELKGIDEIHIGLNDLHLALGLDFLFELLTNGIVEYLAKKIKDKNIPFGIGGVALMDEGKFNGKVIIKEHVRLGSSMVILSRTFKKMLENNSEQLKNEISKIHKEIKIAEQETIQNLLDNNLLVKSYIDEVVKIKRKKNV
jgi:2-keto-3-deoxy-L-rhamnonate aldolase RhmA